MHVMNIKKLTPCVSVQKHKYSCEKRRLQMNQAYILTVYFLLLRY
jgi:hypothetical protein